MSRRRSGTTSTESPFERTRARMVERQLRRRGIGDPRVLAAMGRVPREEFVADSRRRDAYRDGALAIGEEQTISQPWIVAFMAELLELRGTELVLEVGAGSGYSAAVLSLLAAEVITVERHEALAASARERLAALKYANVEVRAGDGALGAPERAPFDAIAVTATAPDRPPQALLDQLAPGAPLVAPLRTGAGERLVRIRDGEAEAFSSVRFVPLIHGT